MKRMATLYGINIDQDFDTSIKTDCTVHETPVQHTGGYHYNFLDRHDIKCPNDQILSSFKLQNFGYVPLQKYIYTCCKPQTYDGCIRPAVTDQKSTQSTPSDGFKSPWEMDKTIECPNAYINSMKLQSSYNPSQTSYNYNCSAVSKQYTTGSCPRENAKDDKRTVNSFCDEKTTPMIPKQGGTFLMPHLVVDCGKGALRNIQLVSQDNTYGYKYTCCTPRVDL